MKREQGKKKVRKVVKKEENKKRKKQDVEGRGRKGSRGAVALVYPCTTTTLAFSSSF